MRQGESIQGVVLAGGLGTRLRPWTATLPKVLMEAGGRPFLAHQLQWFARYGIREVVLCVGYLAEKVEAFAKDGRAFGVRLIYSYEGEKPLGTAGALKKAQRFLKESFCVLNGDSYLPINPLEPIRYFRREDLTALMLTSQNRNRHDRSNTAVREGWVVAYDRRRPRSKMEFIDYGLRLFRKEVLRLIPRGFSDLDGLYQKLIEKNQLAAYPVKEPFYEIGGPVGLARFQRYARQARL